MDLEKEMVKRGEKKKRAILSIKTKQEIIKRHEKGMRLVDIAREYGLNPSTISTILKQKETLKFTTPPKGLSVISKRRSAVNDMMERLLLLWIKDKEIMGDMVTESKICEKATNIFNDLIINSGKETLAQEPYQEFKASRGWFTKFKRRTGIFSVVRHDEASNADKRAVDQRAADEFVQKFKQLVDDEGYILQQVFNCDETSLFWKKMPCHTFITLEEKKTPGHKPMKDHLTLGFCANASGDCKIMPLLVYHSENPRAFKAKKVLKEKLNVLWRANTKAWVTRKIFIDWINTVFGPTVKRYLEDQNLPLKCLLILDEAPAHAPNLEDDIIEEFSFIKVLYFPPNTTSILQPMEQQVISNFKKLYTKQLFKWCFNITKNTELTLREFWKQHFDIIVGLKLIDLAWQNVMSHTINAAWRKLWPDSATSWEFEGFEEPEVDEIILLGNYMGLDVNEEDIDELIQEHHEELSTEELKELEEMQEEFSNNEKDDSNAHIPTCKIEDILAKFHEVVAFVQRNNPEKVFTSQAITHFDYICLEYFRSIVKNRPRQLSFEKYFGKPLQVATTITENDPKPKKAKLGIKKIYYEDKKPNVGLDQNMFI